MASSLRLTDEGRGEGEEGKGGKMGWGEGEKGGEEAKEKWVGKRKGKMGKKGEQKRRRV